MTVASNDRRKIYVGNGAATVFNGPRAFVASHIQAYVDGVLLTSGYSVSNLGFGSTTVTFTAPPANGVSIVLVRTMPLTQDTDITNQGKFLPEIHEDAFDARVMQIQQVADDALRGIKLPLTSNSDGEIAGWSPLGPLVISADGQSVEAGSTQLTGDMLLRPNLAQDAPGKGGDLVAYRDGLSAAFLQVTSAMNQGAPVSVLRGINPTKHAAILDGSATDDHAPAIQALLSEMGSKGRGHLMHDHGTLTIGTQLNIPGDVTFSGGGIKSILKPVATVNAMVRTNGSNAQVRSLQFLNSGGLATAGLTLGADFGRTYDCYFANLKRGIQIDGAQALRIVHPVIIGSDFGIFNINDGRNSVIDQAHIQGGTCIWIDKVSIQNEGLRIVNSFLAPSITADPNSGHGIVITGGLEIEIAQCIIDNVDRYGLYLPNIYTVEAIKLVNSWIGCDAGVTGSCGVVTRGPVKQIQLIANTITGAQGYGLDIDNSAGPPNAFDVSHNRFYSNQAGDYRIRGLIESDIAFNQFNSAVGSAEMDNTSAVRFASNTYTMAPLLKSTGSRYTQSKGVAGVDTDHGTWVPSYINVANATSITNSVACFQQVGKTVYASGNFGASATAANTLTQVRVSPPPGLGIPSGNKAAGSASAYTGSNFIAGICSEHSSGDILVSYQPTGTGGIGIDWSAIWRVA